MSLNSICLLAAALAMATLSACSPARMAADMVGSAMAGDGDVYASEEDPELLLAALPFGLKTMESLIEISPRNEKLRLAAARGFSAYAYIVQQLEAEKGAASTAKQRETDRRVAHLFARARDQAMAGLEARHPGFAEGLHTDRETTLARTGPTDAELLYWAGISWSGAISADKRDLAMVADLPIAAALVLRTAEIDDAFGGGAAHEFLMLYEAGRPGGSLETAEAHYRRAFELSEGNSAGAHVGFAEVIAVARQDAEAFRAALDAAFAIDPDAAPERRLTNVLAQRKARRLLGETENLILIANGGTS